MQLGCEMAVYHSHIVYQTEERYKLDSLPQKICTSPHRQQSDLPFTPKKT